MAQRLDSKVDPDTVFFPMRLKIRLHGVQQKIGAAHASGGVYFRNCMAPGLQLFGSLEIVSHRALGALKGRGTRCDGADNFRMGEDMWLQRCLDNVGAVGIEESELLRDGYCPVAGPKACEFGAVAFHPFKTVQQWQACHVAGSQAPAQPFVSVNLQ